MARVPWPIARDSLALRAGPRRARRSLVALALLVTGYVVSERLVPGVASLWWMGAAAAGVAVGVATRGWTCRVAFSLVVVLLGAGWYGARVRERAEDSIVWAVEKETDEGEMTLATVRGVVLESPRALSPARGALGEFGRSDPAHGFMLALSGIERGSPAEIAPASGTVRVRIAGAKPIPAWLRAGAAVSLTGRIRGVGVRENPGEIDWRAVAAQEGRVGELEVRDVSLAAERSPLGWVERVRSVWHGTIGRLHARCEAAIDGGGAADDPEHARARALLGALLLGERNVALDEVNAAFTRLGLLHLVAISGFNLAVMAALALVGLRLTGDRGWLESAIVAVLVALYMLVLPAQAPILRAGLLVLVLLLADASGRRYDRATLLGWIAVVLLVVRPLDAWSLGFQLSFGIVGSLLLLGETVHARLWGVPLRGLAPTHAPHGRWVWRESAAAALRWCGRWLVRSFQAQVSASVLAWAVSMPIIACHTGQVSPLTPVMTLIVLPLTVIVLWGGYVALLVGVLVPQAAGATAGALDWLAHLLVSAVMRLDRVPGASFELPRISAWWAIVAVGGVVFLVVRGSRRDRWSWAVVLGLAAWLGAELHFGTRVSGSASLRIDTLAVGDGSCHLVRSGSEATLWDCGSLSTGLGERTIPQAVRALGAWRVPTVIVTHAHLDHFSAIPDIVGPLGVKRVIVPPQFRRVADEQPRGAAAALLAELAKRGVRVETRAKGERINIGGHEASVLWPPIDRDFHNPNDHSLMAAIDVPCGARGVRVLLTGDASTEALANLLPQAADSPEWASLRAGVLELPHHGSFIPPAVELVRHCDPLVVLQSSGQRRASDRRWDPLMTGRAWYCTARSGAAWVEVRTDGTVRSGSMK